LHVFESLPKVFIGPTPSMVNSHWIIGGNGPIKKREICLGVFIPLEIFGNYPFFIPVFKEFPLQCRKIWLGVYIIKKSPFGHAEANYRTDKENSVGRTASRLAFK